MEDLEIFGTSNLQDEFNKIQLNQLHNVVLELSKNTFNLKKHCITILLSATTLIVTFTQRKLDTSIFIGTFIIILFFYIADVQSYYYQEKIRIRMKEIANSLGNGNLNKIVTAGVGMPVQDEKNKTGIQHSFLNSSMLFYLFLFIIDLLLFILFLCGVIING